MDLKIYKFGGASVRDGAAIRNVGNIIAHIKDGQYVIVVSATGKTTNALEEVVNSYYTQDGQTESLLEKVKQLHYDIADDLLPSHQALKEDLNESFVTIEWIIEEKPIDEYDYIYDQIVSVGELLSSKILYHYLKNLGTKVAWLDIRDVIVTDETYREARIQWDTTAHKAQSTIKPLFSDIQYVITQGFIGSTPENNTTTLGREGSDYTAAILSYCLDAHSMHIWKDVPGVLTADPRLFDDVVWLPRMSYKEAIEMTYYGAKVIHPKTIKPLQNKQIPLHVRPFDQPTSEGTIISDEKELNYPPVVVIEPHQALLHISTNDFSFVAEHHLSHIFSLLAKYRLKVNMMRNSAISFTVCVNNVNERIEKFKIALGQDFKVVMDENLELITVRHFNEDVLMDMKAHKLILFEEKLSDTVQLVVRNIPRMRRKDSV